jgi:dTDP-glucose pyrophosphorylase
VGTRSDGQNERPRTVCEYLLDRMLWAGATRICFVISPAKTDIVNYFGGKLGDASLCYAIQQAPNGLCDSIFTALPFISPEDEVLIGLPDTVWFPEDGLAYLPDRQFSFLCFPVETPALFDAVVADELGFIREIQVKQPNATSNWIWGALKLPGADLAKLYDLWRIRGQQDQYLGTLVNAYIASGARVRAIMLGETYVDVGTVHGYRKAVQLLSRPYDRRSKLEAA